MPFCGACGEKSPATSLFCGRCGYGLQPPLEQVTSQNDPHATPMSEEPTILTRPLQNVSTNNVEEEEEDESFEWAFKISLGKRVACWSMVCSRAKPQLDLWVDEW